MALWLGEAGGLRLGRAYAGPAYGLLEAVNVDIAEKRFDLGLAKTSLITGDQVKFTRVDNSGVSGGPLDFISGVLDTEITLYVNVDGVGGIRLYDLWSNALEGSLDSALTLVAPSGSYRIAYEVVTNVDLCLAQTTSWTLNTNRDLADFTSLGDAFRQQMGMLVSGSGDITCFFDANWRLQDGSYDTESPVYMHQLAIRQEIGSDFTGVFLLKRTDAIPLDELCNTSDRALFYLANCVVTSVATQLTPGELIQSQIQFVTTGQVRLLHDVAGKYLL